MVMVVAAKTGGRGEPLRNHERERGERGRGRRRRKEGALLSVSLSLSPPFFSSHCLKSSTQACTLPGGAWWLLLLPPPQWPSLSSLPHMLAKEEQGRQICGPENWERGKNPVSSSFVFFFSFFFSLLPRDNWLLDNRLRSSGAFRLGGGEREEREGEGLAGGVGVSIGYKQVLSFLSLPPSH